MLGRFTNGARRGDTLVEVLFAITVFSLIAVGAMTLMNRGVAASQQSVELTSVRQYIDGQAEALRLFHGAYVGSYQPGVTPAATSLAGRYNTILTSHTKTAASEFGGVTCTLPDTSKFIVNTVTGAIETSAVGIVPAVTSAQIVLNESGGFQRAEGIWIEAVRSTATASGGVGFTDFHIRACWSVQNSSQAMTTGTIVRLYDPR